MAKILVVDDQFGIRSMLFETFREEQHEVELAENGAEALRLFISFEPNLILMDMKMPGMNRKKQTEKSKYITNNSTKFSDKPVYNYKEIR